MLVCFSGNSFAAAASRLTAPIIVVLVGAGTTRALGTALQWQGGRVIREESLFLQVVSSRTA